MRAPRAAALCSSTDDCFGCFITSKTWWCIYPFGQLVGQSVSFLECFALLTSRLAQKESSLLALCLQPFRNHLRSSKHCHHIEPSSRCDLSQLLSREAQALKHASHFAGLELDPFMISDSLDLKLRQSQVSKISMINDQCCRIAIWDE